MASAWSKCSVRLLVVVTMSTACSSQPALSARDAADANDTGRTLAGKTEGERALLARLAGLPTGAPERFGDTTVVAEAAYAAASGRTCRVLRIGSAPKQTRERLACSDGQAWFFVPDVFGMAGAGE